MPDDATGGQGPAAWKRWRALEPLFDAALELPPEERAVYLRDAAGDDEELQEAVDELLRGLSEADDPTRPATMAFPALVADLASTQSRIGERIGPYRIVAEAGRGGMGAVYVADRADDQYTSRVALKLLRPGLNDQSFVRRFVEERQILASLVHPRIARLYDGGVTDDGQPWFAMEYVEGLPIDEYCDNKKLPISDRLRLFHDVCDAVQHAHRNLVIHRDLKPSNILVGKGREPKLLDFGIAKVLASPAEGITDSTRTSHRALTPQYASPEQIRGQHVSTSSDVYSLGVVLYKLLTGVHPHRVRSDEPFALERGILEDEPERPSVAIALALDAAVAARATSRRALRRRLAGDLDTIVLMALRKEPERRYASVEQFAADIWQHLEGRPVAARRDTWGYRSRVFLKRHPFGVSAATLLVLLLGGFSLSTRLQLARVQVERERSEEISGFLAQLFIAQNPLYASEALSARNILDTATARLLRNRRVRPQARAQLLNMLGFTYWQLKNLSQARQLLDSSVAIHAQNRTDPKDLNYRIARGRLWAVAAEQGDWVVAESLARSNLAIARTAFGRNSRQEVEALSYLGATMWAVERDDEAVVVLRQAIAVARNLPPTARVVPLRYLGLAILESKLSQREAYLLEAETAINEAYELMVTPGGAALPAGLTDLVIAEALIRDVRGDSSGERLLRDHLDSLRRSLGDDNTWVDYEKTTLADIAFHRGAFVKAESIYHSVLPRMQAPGKMRPLDQPSFPLGFFWILAARGHYAMAESLAREALSTNLRFFKPGGWRVAEAKAALGVALVHRRQYAEALPLLEDALPIVTERFGPDNHRTVAARKALEQIWSLPRSARPVRRISGD